MKHRSLILLVIASICLQSVIAQDLRFFGHTSRTILVDKQELDLHVFTGSLKDFNGHRGDFQIEIGGYTTNITGYPFDPAVKLSKETGILAKSFHDASKLSLRFDINDFNGRGGSITNVASITRITVTNTSITYFGKDADGNDYSKKFDCNPKFEPVEGGKFIIFVGVKDNLPRNLKSDLKSADTTESASMSSGELILVISLPTCAAVLGLITCSVLGFLYWRNNEKYKAADNKIVSVESRTKPKSPKKDRDVEAQKDEGRTETKDDDSERTRKAKHG